jgi:hypothetical protein
MARKRGDQMQRKTAREIVTDIPLGSGWEDRWLAALDVELDALRKARDDAVTVIAELRAENERLRTALLLILEGISRDPRIRCPYCGEEVHPSWCPAYIAGAVLEGEE